MLETPQDACNLLGEEFQKAADNPGNTMSGHAIHVMQMKDSYDTRSFMKNAGLYSQFSGSGGPEAPHYYHFDVAPNKPQWVRFRVKQWMNSKQYTTPLNGEEFLKVDDYLTMYEDMYSACPMHSGAPTGDDVVGMTLKSINQLHAGLNMCTTRSTDYAKTWAKECEAINKKRRTPKDAQWPWDRQPHFARPEGVQEPGQDEEEIPEEIPEVPPLVRRYAMPTFDEARQKATTPMPLQKSSSAGTKHRGNCAMSSDPTIEGATDHATYHFKLR